MRPFKFGLDKVLNLRRELEQKKAQVLAQARTREEGANAARRALVERRDEGRQRLAVASQDGGAVGHIQNMDYVIACVDDQIAEANVACDQAAEEVTESLREFRTAYAERKSLDHLRDRKEAVWRERAQRKEQNEMDEVATTRHVRAESTASSQEPRNR